MAIKPKNVGSINIDVTAVSIKMADNASSIFIAFLGYQDNDWLRKSHYRLVLQSIACFAILPGMYWTTPERELSGSAVAVA